MRRLLTVAVAGLLLGGCSELSQAPDMATIEDDIKSDLAKQLNKKVRQSGLSGRARVKRVQCVERSERRARCFAELKGNTAELGEDRVGIDVTINPDDGSYLWEVRE